MKCLGTWVNSSHSDQAVKPGLVPETSLMSCMYSELSSCCAVLPGTSEGRRCSMSQTRCLAGTESYDLATSRSGSTSSTRKRRSFSVAPLGPSPPACARLAGGSPPWRLLGGAMGGGCSGGVTAPRPAPKRGGTCRSEQRTVARRFEGAGEGRSEQPRRIRGLPGVSRARPRAAGPDGASGDAGRRLRGAGGLVVDESGAGPVRGQRQLSIILANYYSY